MIIIFPITLPHLPLPFSPLILRTHFGPGLVLGFSFCAFTCGLLLASCRGPPIPLPPDPMPPSFGRLLLQLQAVANSAADLQAAAAWLPESSSLRDPATLLAQEAAAALDLLPDEEEFDDSDWEEDPELLEQAAANKRNVEEAKLQPASKRLVKARPLPRVLPLYRLGVDPKLFPMSVPPASSFRPYPAAPSANPTASASSAPPPRTLPPPAPSSRTVPPPRTPPETPACPSHPIPPPNTPPGVLRGWVCPHCRARQTVDCGFCNLCGEDRPS